MLSYFGDRNTECGVAGTAIPLPDTGPITG
jgi:hypothetical protein